MTSREDPTVVQIIPHRQLGGMQEIAGLLDERLPGLGVRSQVVALDDLIDGETTRARRLAAWRTLRDRWRLEPPDAVVAHTPKGAAYALSAAHAAGVPRRYCVVHGSRATYGSVATVLVATLAQTRVITGIVCCGQAAAATFARVPGRFTRICQVIQNGIQLPEPAAATATAAATPNGSARRDETPYVVCVGRLVPGKNVDTVVRAAAATAGRVRLVVCGDGPQEDALRALAEAVDAPVTFAGRVTRAEIARLYESALAFVFPSKGEGLPLVLIEAAWAGLPMVLAERPYNREVLGDSALYVDADDVEAWARALDRLASDPALRHALADGAARRAAHFSADRMARDYAELLRAR